MTELTDVSNAKQHYIPPYAKAKCGQEYNNNSRNRGSNRNGNNFSIKLTTIAIKVTPTVALFQISVYNFASSSSRAIVGGTRFAKASSFFRIARKSIAISWQAFTLEVSKAIDATCVAGITVVQKGIGTFVNVRHPGNGIESTINKEISVSDVVPACLKRDW